MNSSIWHIRIGILIWILCIHAEKLPIDSTNLEHYSKSTSSPCQWDNDDCEIRCLDGANSSAYVDSIHSLYDSSDECEPHGINLILPKDYFTDKTLPVNWLAVDAKIVGLDVDFDKISVIEYNAFGSGLFAYVKKFVIRNFWPDKSFTQYTFAGLSSLENLNLLNVQLVVGRLSDITISYALLESAKNTLNSMTLIERHDDYNKSFPIERMLGFPSPTFVNLEYVNIKYNLTIIYYTSLTAITSNRQLDLSECFISVIQNKSFDNLATLRILNLERNLLVTLPDGIFTKLNLSPVMPEKALGEAALSVYLGDNPWHCDCELVSAKELLNQYSNFNGDILCKTPQEIENYPIKESEFCPDPITTIRTTSIISTETTETSHNEKFIEPFCRWDCSESARFLSVTDPTYKIKFYR